MCVCVNDAQQVEVVISTSWHEKGRIKNRGGISMICFIDLCFKIIDTQK